MALIQVAYHDNIGVLKLNRRVTNAINLELVTTLTEKLKELNQAPNLHGFVITSANEKFFSIGFDIPELIDLTEDGFREFYHSFNQLCIDLYTFPKPIIAAITGHAVAGGCILALCCDYRFIASGKKLMGLNEIKLGVPIPYPADCILHQLVGYRNARDIVDTGEFFPPERLLTMGMVDEVLPVEEVLPRAIEKMQMLSAMPQGGFKKIKQNRTEKVEALIKRDLAEKENIFAECWYSQDARQRLREATKKF
jgi:enoyl-CoA hydratase/carnithine racemase